MEINDKRAAGMFSVPGKGVPVCYLCSTLEEHQQHMAKVKVTKFNLLLFFKASHIFIEIIVNCYSDLALFTEPTCAGCMMGSYASLSVCALLCHSTKIYRTLIHISKNIAPRPYGYEIWSEHGYGRPQE